MYILGANMDI